jgi:hypothetical protein
MACKWRRSDVACTSRKLRCSGPTTGQSLVGRTSARSRANDINPAIAEHLGIVIVDHGSRKSDSNAMLHEVSGILHGTLACKMCPLGRETTPAPLENLTLNSLSPHGHHVIELSYCSPSHYPFSLAGCIRRPWGLRWWKSLTWK